MFTKLFFIIFSIFAILAISGCSIKETALPSSTSAPKLTSIPTTRSLATPTPTEKAPELSGPHKLISQERLLAYVKDLTDLGSYSGWRNSATEGETEAFDYVAKTLSDLPYLQSLGLELERQSFHVFLSTEIWESRLFLTINGEEIEVPINAITGHRKDAIQALRFDSDGVFNDADRNPVEVNGDVLILRSIDDVLNLHQEDAQGKIVFLDFSVINPEDAGEGAGAEIVTTLVEKNVAGLVLVTEEGYGKNAGDGTILEDIRAKGTIPMLYVRLEDLETAGISSLEELERIEIDLIRLIWDTDVFSPGKSGNLVARIPGMDSTQAVILGAHIDSANSPGAGDNALNCAVLMEVARVLDEGVVQPPVDIYLVWFGSHELGFYGSQHFVNTHQELLDRTLAAFLLDGFTADQPGATILGIQESSQARFGNIQLPFADFLSKQAQIYQIPIEMVIDHPIFSSDDGPFYGFVPAVRFAFGSNRIGKNFHSPYDTYKNIQDQGEVMEQTVSMALIAALDAYEDKYALRVLPEPERRALIIATHTEVLHMTPTMLINLDRALSWEGFDVDVIPYGQSLTLDDLTDVDLVLVLPVIDYPSADVDLTLYEEEWLADEVDLLVSYVEQGGFLVLTNSANRLFFGEVADFNEDWEKNNALATIFGINYESDPIPIAASRIANSHPLTENLSVLRLIAHNGLPINLQTGEVLAEIGGQVVLGLVDYGDAGGLVVALSDLGSLDIYDFRQHEKDNFTFLRNLARYARDR